jgi:hypothetical protein
LAALAEQEQVAIFKPLAEQAEAAALPVPAEAFITAEAAGRVRNLATAATAATAVRVLASCFMQAAVASAAATVLAKQIHPTAAARAVAHLVRQLITRFPAPIALAVTPSIRLVRQFVSHSTALLAVAAETL